MTDTKTKALFIRGNRSGYGPEQVEHMTMSIGELIDMLEEMRDMLGDEAPVFLSNDRGYTYGHIGWGDVAAGAYDEHGVEFEDYDGEW